MTYNYKSAYLNAAIRNLAFMDRVNFFIQEDDYGYSDIESSVIDYIDMSEDKEKSIIELLTQYINIKPYIIESINKNFPEYKDFVNNILLLI